MFRGNKIYLYDKKGKKHRIFFIPGVYVRFRGKNATIELHSPIPKFQKSRIECRDNAKVTIGGSNYKVRNMTILAHGKNSVCNIGKDFSATRGCKLFLHCEDNLKISIGDDCMFGSNIIIRTSDAHTIIDNTTNKVINLGKDVSIGNHCWLGRNVTVLKGVTIADNSVIGTDSLVAKSCIEKNSIYAGNPAKLIKSNTNWDRSFPREN